MRRKIVRKNPFHFNGLSKSNRCKTTKEWRGFSAKQAVNPFPHFVWAWLWQLHDETVYWKMFFQRKQFFYTSTSRFSSDVASPSIGNFPNLDFFFHFPCFMLFLLLFGFVAFNLFSLLMFIYLCFPLFFFCFFSLFLCCEMSKGICWTACETNCQQLFHTT